VIFVSIGYIESTAVLPTGQRIGRITQKETSKKVRALQIHGRILAGGIFPDIKLFPARESLVSDIPARDGRIVILFLQCMSNGFFQHQEEMV
jgi:hypothetical protein